MASSEVNLLGQVSGVARERIVVASHVTTLKWNFLVWEIAVEVRETLL